MSYPLNAPGLPTNHKVIIGLTVAFTAVVLTLELYWLVFNQEMENRIDVLARALACRLHQSHPRVEKAFDFVARGMNTLFTPIPSFVLIWAILARKSYRYPLQLVIATYTVYGRSSTTASRIISGYAVFEYKTAYTCLLFYLVNMPWFVGYGWMGWDAFREIVRAQRTRS